MAELTQKQLFKRSAIVNGGFVAASALFILLVPVVGGLGFLVLIIWFGTAVYLQLTTRCPKCGSHVLFAVNKEWYSFLHVPRMCPWCRYEFASAEN